MTALNLGERVTVILRDGTEVTGTVDDPHDSYWLWVGGTMIDWEDVYRIVRPWVGGIPGLPGRYRVSADRGLWWVGK
jgi:hypothetical protein